MNIQDIPASQGSDVRAELAKLPVEELRRLQNFLGDVIRDVTRGDGRELVVMFTPSVNNLIGTTKAIREATGTPLRESADLAKTGRVHVASTAEAQDLVRRLKDSGVIAEIG